MEAVLLLLCIQGVVGAFDNIYHHLLTERLHTRPTARKELALHTVREFLYGITTLGLAWFTWAGAWALVLAAVFAIEGVITLWDFVEEDRSRKLPPLERVIHSLLAVNLGVLLAIFAPLWFAWAGQETALSVVYNGAFSWVLTVLGIGVFGWSVFDLWVVSRLSVPGWMRHPIKRGRNDHPKRVLVTGATGFIGRALVRALVERGDRVLILARSAEKARDLFGPHAEVVTDLAGIAPDTAIDAVVNLAGAPVLGWPWTAARRNQLLDSRVGTTGDLITLFCRLARPPRVLVSGSAIGFYGRRGDEDLAESDGPAEGFMSALCREWESAAQGAKPMGVRVCRLRLGMVLGADGGALARFLPPVRLGLGAVFGSGLQWVSWIHLHDLTRLILFALDRDTMRGAVNAVSPAPVTGRQLMTALGRQLRRPVLFRVPAWLLRHALGEMADLLVAGQKVRPQRAVAEGFAFTFPDIDTALGDLTGRTRVPWPEKGVTTVHFNDDCPVCNSEIRHYGRILEEAGAPLRLRPVTRFGDDLAAYGIHEEDRRRRLYVSDQDGNLTGGVDAQVAIWRQTPKYRWAAFLVGLPGLHAMAEVIYELIIVPALANRNARKALDKAVPAPGS